MQTAIPHEEDEVETTPLPPKKKKKPTGDSRPKLISPKFARKVQIFSVCINIIQELKEEQEALKKQEEEATEEQKWALYWPIKNTEEAIGALERLSRLSEDIDVEDYEAIQHLEGPLYLELASYIAPELRRINPEGDYLPGIIGSEDFIGTAAELSQYTCDRVIRIHREKKAESGLIDFN